MRSLQVEAGNSWDNSAIGQDGLPNGWFMGSSRFIKGETLRANDIVELKWSQFAKGFDAGIKPCSPFRGISILIEGRFQILFRDSPDEPWREYNMEKCGDFIISHGGLDHISRALEDSVLLTVRLSIPITPEDIEADTKTRAG